MGACSACTRGVHQICGWHLSWLPKVLQHSEPHAVGKSWGGSAATNAGASNATLPAEKNTAVSEGSQDQDLESRTRLAVQCLRFGSAGRLPSFYEVLPHPSFCNVQTLLNAIRRPKARIFAGCENMA